ncbi:MAG: glycosyltransferase family 39 protein [Candidatus Nanoarchaeia archaeon]|nr:glycosyltransferase family 39 protein [Candidatus Nanoarchaeia archaeon]
MAEKKIYDRILDGALNVFFSKDRTKLYLLGIFILGLILRIIAAVNLGVFADDMHFAPHAVGFISSGKLQTWDQPPMWYFLTDMAYKILGTTQLASRLASVLFGAFSIILIFLIAKEIFRSKQIALIAGFLVAVSPYLIKNNLAEMDATVMFFILTAVLLFIKGLEKNKFYLLVISFVFLGVSLLTKHYAMLFLPAFFLIFIANKYKNKEKAGKIIWQVIILGIVFAVSVLPILASNYLLYKDKGFLDFQFNRLVGLGSEKAAQYYSWAAGWNEKADYRGFFLGGSRNYYTKTPTSLVSLGYMFYGCPVIFMLGILGLWLFYRKNKKYFAFFVLLLLVPWFMLGSVSLLPKHYLFGILLLSLPAAALISTIQEKSRIRLRYILIAILIFNLIYLGSSTDTSGHFYSTSAIQKMISFKQQNILPSALVITDSRIYRGEIVWMFNDRSYIEGNDFYQVTQEHDKLPGNAVPTEVFFIECGIDDCGWGTVKNQPEFNQSMENLVDFFKNSSTEIPISQLTPGFYLPFMKKGEETYLKVYRANLLLKPAVFEIAKSTHSWFLYPIGYDKTIQPIFDDYSTYNSFDEILNSLARLILYLAVAIAILSLPLIIILIILEND